jgi:hypothetical protein
MGEETLRETAMKQPLVLLAALALAAPAGAAEFELTEGDDIGHAVAISDAVDMATETVGACIDGGGAHRDCLCAAGPEIAQLRTALDDALAVHPEWRGQTISVADTGDGEFQSLTLFLDTVAASATPPDCG